MNRVLEEFDPWEGRTPEAGSWDDEDGLEAFVPGNGSPKPKATPTPEVIPPPPPVVIVPMPRAAPERPTETVSEPSTATVASRGPNREVDYRCAVMDAPGLSVHARYAGLAIVRHCFRSGELFAGMEKVAEWMGLSPESRKQVSKYVGELVAAGFLTPVGKVRRTVKYRLTLPG